LSEESKTTFSVGLGPDLKFAEAFELSLLELGTEAVDLYDSITLFPNAFGRWRERVALLNRVRTVAAREAGAGALTRTGYLLASREGDDLLQQGRAAAAERVFRAVGATGGGRGL